MAKKRTYQQRQAAKLAGARRAVSSRAGVPYRKKSKANTGKIISEVFSLFRLFK